MDDERLLFNSPQKTINMIIQKNPLRGSCARHAFDSAADWFEDTTQLYFSATIRLFDAACFIPHSFNNSAPATIPPPMSK